MEPGAQVEGLWGQEGLPDLITIAHYVLGKTEAVTAEFSPKAL